MTAASGVPAALRQALAECAAAGLAGALRVSGDPGGTVHLAGGTIAAAETPGAPGPEVLLLRSHRMTESGWDAAFAATAAAGGKMSAELVARGLVGAGELEALLRTAVADAMFVLASGHVDECGLDEHGAYGSGPPVLPLEPGAGADWALAEAERRMGVLASLPVPPGQDRVSAAPGAMSPDARLGEGRDEILALADGRRSARDIAFALGRGVYATMLQVARMREAGLLVSLPYRMVPPPDPAGLPRRGGSLPRRTGQPAVGLLKPRVGEVSQK